MWCTSALDFVDNLLCFQTWNLFPLTNFLWVSPFTRLYVTCTDGYIMMCIYVAILEAIQNMGYNWLSENQALAINHLVCVGIMCSFIRSLSLSCSATWPQSRHLISFQWRMPHAQSPRIRPAQRPSTPDPFPPSWGRVCARARDAVNYKRALCGAVSRCNDV